MSREEPRRARGGPGPERNGLRSHQLLEHTSEARLLVRAPTWPELLAEAGLAVGELERRGAAGGVVGLEREISVSAGDAETLLVEFLNEIVFLAERNRWIPLELDVLQADERHIRARGRGMTLPEPPSLVKAATMHGLTLDRTGGVCKAEVVLDI